MAEHIFFVGDFVRWKGWNALVSEVSHYGKVLSLRFPSGRERKDVNSVDVKFVGDGLSVANELRAEIDRLSRLLVEQCHETERLKRWRDSLRKAIADDGWFDDE